jgi:hypothetical protein
MPRCHNLLKQVGCKRGKTAFPRQVVPEECDVPGLRGYFQNLGAPIPFLLLCRWQPVHLMDNCPGRPPELLIHAAVTRVSLTRSVLSSPARSAASWQWIQRADHGTAARRLGLIADSHSMQLPKLPS